MGDELSRVKKVVKQEGNNVLISVPMAGFWEGYELRPGDRVTLVIEKDGRPVVRPLVHFKEIDNFSPEIESDLVEIDGQKLAIQKNAVLSNAEGQAQRAEVFIVDSDSEEPEQIIAIRSRS